MVAFLPEEKSKKYEGKSIDDIAKSETINPIDWVCDTLLDNDGSGMYILMGLHTEGYVFSTLRDPNEHVMSDAGPLHHTASYMWGNLIPDAMVPIRGF